MTNILVTVVIPSYNREHTIIRAIESVLSQTYKEIECVVVDDCSTDKTVEIVEASYRDNSRVRVFKLPENSGACVARNKGVELAKGEYVAFLDSDDCFRPEKIERQMETINKTGAQFCSTGFVAIRPDGSEMTVLPYSGNKDEIYNQLLYLNCITTGVLCGKKDCLLETPFDKGQPRYQDWDLALRLFKKYNFVFIDYVGLELISQPVSISSSTSHEKSLKALSVIYERNIDGYNSNRKADSQIHWLMGLHSLFVPGKKDLKALWKGVVGYKFSLRRFLFFVAAILGLKNFYTNTIQHV